MSFQAGRQLRCIVWTPHGLGSRLFLFASLSGAGHGHGLIASSGRTANQPPTHTPTTATTHHRHHPPPPPPPRPPAHPPIRPTQSPNKAFSAGRGWRLRIKRVLGHIFAGPSTHFICLNPPNLTRGGMWHLPFGGMHMQCCTVCSNSHTNAPGTPDLHGPLLVRSWPRPLAAGDCLRLPTVIMFKPLFPPSVSTASLSLFFCLDIRRLPFCWCIPVGGRGRFRAGNFVGLRLQERWRISPPTDFRGVGGAVKMPMSLHCVGP